MTPAEIEEAIQKLNDLTTNLGEFISKLHNQLHGVAHRVADLEERLNGSN